MKRLTFLILAFSCSLVCAGTESLAIKPATSSQKSIDAKAVARRCHITKIWGFGDSLTDTGNKWVINKKYDPQRATNRDEKTGQGKVWIEYFAESLGLPTPTPSGHPGTRRKLSGGTNYAVIGGKAIKGNYDDVPNQISAYLAKHKPKPTDLFCINGGSNDTINRAAFRSVKNLQELKKKKLINHGKEKKVAQSLARQAKRLVNAGAKWVIVQSVPDLGLTPAASVSGTSRQLTGWAQRANQILEADLDKLRETSDANIIFIDTFHIMHDLLKQREKHGFKATLTSYCIAAPERKYWFRTYVGEGLPPFNVSRHYTPAECMFWDPIHPTTKAHRCIAELILKEFCEQVEELPVK